MRCDHCCGADKFFDLKIARKQLRRYNKKGPLKSTKRLLESLKDHNFNQKTLLDIGGGIGAISWQFLKNGGKSITGIDSSNAYISIVREYADQNGWKDQSTFIVDDFTDVSDNISSHDFVSLDKVICCYPDYKLLLNTCLDKCENILAITYPLGGVIARILNQFSSLILRLSKNPFRPYIHPPKKIRELILSNGFQPVQQSISFPWYVEVYQRKQPC